MSQAAPAQAEQAPMVRHNQLGERYSIKLVYPGYFLGMKAGEKENSISFPRTRERLAKKVQPGHLFFVYVTSPERQFIGLAEATTRVSFEPEADYKRPWQTRLAWVIGPKYPGVQLSRVLSQVKPRVGDSVYGITDETAADIIDLLQELPDMDGAALLYLKTRYRMFA